ncbi:MAG: GMC family oxidoreductase [Pseudomonadota bacterium]
MDIQNLNALADGTQLETDLLIIGGGAAGLTIAREFFGSPWQVMVVESGDTEQTDEHELLNEVELDSQTVPETWKTRRSEYHGHQAEKWSVDVQRFGVRCRGLGGSTAAWAGKSAPFSPHDFEKRDWLEYSGWPFSRDDLMPFIRRAETRLNLGEGSYGNDFWDHYPGRSQQPEYDPEKFSSFFWQFSRSRINPVNMTRMGPEFMRETAENTRVLVNATARSITPKTEHGATAVTVALTGINAGDVSVTAKHVVVACGALENARLLLASKTVCPSGLGNERDQVGRYLMDHMNAPVVKFDDKYTKTICDRFGFIGLQGPRRVDMYMHGMELGSVVQAQEGLVNAGAYVVADRAEDDPWGALATLLRGQSKAPLKDMFSIIKGAGMMFTGAGRLFLQSDRVPNWLKMPIVNTFVKLMPNFVVEEYQNKGVPHKLVSCGFDAIVEQEPLPENRVMLSETLNRFGEPLPLVKWEPGERSLKTLMRTGELIAEQFEQAGLPVPEVADWIKNKSLEDAPIIDTAHTSGTTRMSVDPNTGVVDENCKIHSCEGVYIAGGSVLPTCGHANPTLMITSVAIRLADHLKEQMAKAPELSEGSISEPQENEATAA